MCNIPIYSYILWCPFVNGDNLTLKMRTLHFENIKIWKEIGLLLFFSCSLLSCFFVGGGVDAELLIMCKMEFGHNLKIYICMYKTKKFRDCGLGADVL